MLLSEADGLLEVLRLPNNIADLSAPSSSAHASTKEPKHMAFLSKSGMLKRRGYPPSLDMVGLPTTVTFSLQQKLINLLSEVAIFISPPHMVRGAIVEGVNLPLENFLAFTDGSVVGFPVYLTGHSLPSLISLFVKKLIPFRSTTWPLRVFSSGTAYQNFLLNPRREEGCAFKLNLGNVAQRTKVAMLSFCRSRVEELAEFSLLKTLILELCNKSLSYEFSFVELHPNALHSYESAAVVLLYGTDVIARIGCSGEYISQRLNIACGEDRVSSKFAWLIYTEIDVTSAIGMIVEEHVMGESPIPEDIRELI